MVSIPEDQKSNDLKKDGINESSLENKLPDVDERKYKSDLRFFAASVVVGAVLSLGLTWWVKYNPKSHSSTTIDHILLPSSAIQKRNVVGNSELDEFYDSDHGRAYLKIDGKTVEEYFRGR